MNIGIKVRLNGHKYFRYIFRANFVHFINTFLKVDAIVVILYQYKNNEDYSYVKAFRTTLLN